MRRYRRSTRSEEDEEQLLSYASQTLSPKSRKRCEYFYTHLLSKAVSILSLILLVNAIRIRIVKRNGSYESSTLPSIETTSQSSFYSPSAPSVSSSTSSSTTTSISNNGHFDKESRKGENDICDPRVLTTQSRRFPWERKFYYNRHDFQPCTFTPIDEGGPIPAIFLVNGRSGSDVTWASITTLAGKKSPIGT